MTGTADGFAAGGFAAGGFDAATCTLTLELASDDGGAVPLRLALRSAGHAAVGSGDDAVAFEVAYNLVETAVQSAIDAL